MRGLNSLVPPCQLLSKTPPKPDLSPPALFQVPKPYSGLPEPLSWAQGVGKLQLSSCYLRLIENVLYPAGLFPCSPLAKHIVAGQGERGQLSLKPIQVQVIQFLYQGRITPF